MGFTLFFLFGVLAVLAIALVGVCCGFMILGAAATVHRFVFVPIMQASARGASEMAAPACPYGTYAEASRRHQDLIALIAKKRVILDAAQARLSFFRGQLRRWNRECDRIASTIPSGIRGTTAELGVAGFAHAVERSACFAFWEALVASECGELVADLWLLVADLRSLDEKWGFSRQTRSFGPYR